MLARTVAPMRTIWVFGDQLNRHLGPLRDADPAVDHVLLVESTAKLAGKRWHVQRAHLVIAAMRRFAAELRADGFDVDHRRAPTLAAGLAAHRQDHVPTEVVAMEPASWDGRLLLERVGVTVEPNEQFLCSYGEFAEWAEGRRSLKMEDFYRWQRRRLDYLMDGEEPCGGRWNFDHDNREPPPSGPSHWPEPVISALDDIDTAVLDDLADLSTWGSAPRGVWATSRSEALRRLDHAIEAVAPRFGPHEDAMLSTSWQLAHTLLSPYLNIGLLHPREVCDRVEEAYRAGAVPIASAEGLIRQIIGWREYVWGLYWLWMPDYRDQNALGAHRPLPPLFSSAPTHMRCVQHTLADIETYGWTHHIQRLMIIGNLCLLAGVEPGEVVEWMWASFVDGAEWVMVPNVIGMALHADGGRMATKPYAGGGAYIDRMSDYCKGCHYDRKARTGDRACPFTTLYWDFLDRHRDRFARNPRMAQQVRSLDRLSDLDDVRNRAREVLVALDRGEL
jgi:deoxyribodipyrimidine photolyase-related protein